MLFMELIAVYCENRKKHVNALCEQSAEFLFNPFKTKRICFV
jgi:hypothetical protein